MSEGTYHVTSTPEYVSVSWRGESKTSFQRGTAEASDFGPYWYINRVIVQPEDMRDKGIGGKLLRMLLVEIAKVEQQKLLDLQWDDEDEVRTLYGCPFPAKRVVVDPGGYNMNVDRQRAFYRKHGFKDDLDEQGRMYIDLTTPVSTC